MLQFDENGHLTPITPIETTLDEFQQVFVDAFPRSTTRKRLFDNYLDWVFDFQRDIFGYFTQWIDGSFVTRKENPNDIDFVTFLDDEVYVLRNTKLDRFWSFSNESRGLDAYIMPEYKHNHPNFALLEERKKVWLDLFTSVRAIEDQPKLNKGFIQISFIKS